MSKDFFALNDIDPDDIRPASSKAKMTESTAAPKKEEQKSNDNFFTQNKVDPEEIRAQEASKSWIPRHPISDITMGIATAGKNLHNFIPELLKQGQNLGNKAFPMLDKNNINYDAMKDTNDYSNMLGPNSKGDALLQGGSQFIGAPELGGGALGQAAYGAAQTPDNPGLGAVFGAGGQKVSEGLMYLLNKLRPSQLFRGKLSPEELKENLQQTKGTNTGLGQVIQSPMLNRAYENVLPHIPFSGASEKMQNTAMQVTDKGEKLLSDLEGNAAPGDYGVTLQNALKKAAQGARSEKNANYNKVNDLADNANFKVNTNENYDILKQDEQNPALKVGRENFAKTAQKKLADIEKSPELKEEIGGDILGKLNRYANNPEGNTLKLSNIFKGVLGDKASDFYANGKMYEYGIMKELQDSLKSDIDSSIANSGNKELKAAYEKAEKDYATKFAPFEDKDIVKFTRKGGDPDLILNHFLRKGSQDRSKLLQKLISKLPEHEKSLIRNAYLARSRDAEGRVNPQELAKLYRNLGNKQKEILFPDKKLNKELQNFTGLVGKNAESFRTMFNPPTGQRNLDFLTQLLATSLGGHFGGGAGALATLGIPIAARQGANALSSEKLRTSLVKKMIEGKPWEIDPRHLKRLGILLNAGNAAYNAQGNDNG